MSVTTCSTCNENLEFHNEEWVSISEPRAEHYVNVCAGNAAHIPTNPRIVAQAQWRDAVAFFHAAFPQNRNTVAVLANDWCAFGHRTYTMEEYAERERVARVTRNRA